MRSHDTDSVFLYVVGSHADQINVLSAVVVIHLIARFQFRTEFIGLIAAFFRFRRHVCAGFTLRFRAVDEFLVAVRIREDFFHRLLIRHFVHVRSFVCKFAHFIKYLRKFSFV